VRLGLRMVKGLSEEGAAYIVNARHDRAFADMEDFVVRAQVNRHDLNCLSEADALKSLAGHRRLALWAALGMEFNRAPLAMAQRREIQPDLLAPTEGEEIVADFRRLGLTLRRHPLALLRAKLGVLRFASAEGVQAARHGQLIRAAGIVTGRQRPGTASGVTFVTLEDETGYINVVVWRDLAERQRKELLGSRLLGVYGTIEKKGKVVHLIAGRLVDHSALLGRVVTASRDFH
jgi:error-prone DNA polymerase